MGWFVVVVALALMTLPSAALAADPPFGADISESLDYAPVPASGLSNGALICPGFKSR
jgi:hypothetical protein